MRRKERKRKNRRKKIFSIIALFIMVFGFGLAGIVMRNPTGQQQSGGGSGTIQYNGYEFTRENNRYVADVAGQERTFYYPPTRTVSVAVPNRIPSLLEDGFTVTFSPDRSDMQFVDLARFQLTEHLSGVQSAVTTSSPQYTLPVVTCDDATTQRPVVYLNRSNRTSVTRDGACIVVNGNGREQLRAAERVLYTALGVIE